MLTITNGPPFIPSVVLKEDPTFVVYEQMDVYGTFNNVYTLMLKTLLDYGGFGLEDFVRKLICMGFDGGFSFHGHLYFIGVTTQIEEKVASFLLGVHSCVHNTNLTIIILSKLELVHLLKAFCNPSIGILSIFQKTYWSFKTVLKLWKH